MIFPRPRWVFVALLALCGCATHQPPVVSVRTVTVEKPVPVPCVQSAAIPAEPPKIGKLPADARQAADSLAAKAIDLRTWGEGLWAMLAACSK